MNTAIILAGGTGTRLGTDTPKQFLEEDGNPVISFCLSTFQNHTDIDGVVIVAADMWREYILSWLDKLNITKFRDFADPGKTRQHSIYNALKLCAQFMVNDFDTVIIHDAARPFVTDKIISQCISAASEKDGAMPVLRVKDTIYLSKSGHAIDSLLNRNELFAGQAPESFNFKKYYKIHNEVSDEEISLTAGSSEIAYRHGMDIALVEGDERNFKITTKSDLQAFITILNKNKEEIK